MKYIGASFFRHFETRRYNKTWIKTKLKITFIRTPNLQRWGQFTTVLS
jgi:hypothetical protein